MLSLEKKSSFRHTFLFLFSLDGDLFYFLCHGHVFGHFDKTYHLWLSEVKLVDE